MLRAERGCCKKRKGGYSWSPALSKAGWTVRYWKLKLRLIQQEIPLPPYATQIRDWCEISDDVESVEEVRIG